MNIHPACAIGCALLSACAATPASRAPCTAPGPAAVEPNRMQPLPAMPDPEHPAFGFLRYPFDKSERSWQPLPCKSITIDHDSTWPSFKLRSVTLFRDGRAIAHNRYHQLASKREADYEGRFEGHVDREGYALLCYMLERADFWHLQPEYTAQISDCPANVIVVEGERGAHRVRDHCRRGPVDLIAFEFAFEQIAADVSWKRSADLQPASK